MNPIPKTSPLNNCSTCVLGQFCLPVGLSHSDLDKVDALVKERIALKKGDSLYRHGNPMTSVYSIRFGTLKTEHGLSDGRSQIIGFHLPGEILGLDAIGDGIHQSDATLQNQFHRILSRELTQDQRHLLSLGSMRAEERLAGFLLNLSERLTARGYTNHEFDLRMSREEMGSYLGIQIETVSRMLSRFVEAGLIQIKQRHVKLIDIGGLYELAGLPNPENRGPLQACL